MSHLVDVPGGDAQSVDFADWAELTTLFSRDGNTSREDLACAIRRPGFVGQNRARQFAEEAFDELADRERTLGFSSSGRRRIYPFKLTDGGEVLQSTFSGINKERDGLAYLFMLAISRWPMHSSKRKLKSVDPTATFERLCAHALQSYLGANDSASNGLTLGTSSGRSRIKFPSIVNSLCTGLREGIGWKADAISPGSGDGGLDIAVWKQFCDDREGRIVAFAQCKTGIHWEMDLGKLTPRAFCRNYFQRDLVLEPIPVYMVPNRIVARDWRRHTDQCRGIILDRCRISQFAPDTRLAPMSECRTWLKEALKLTRAR